MAIRKWLLFGFDFILPFPLFPAMFYLWYLRTGGHMLYAAYVLLLPLVWGYVLPGIGTNIMKLWRFRGPILWGNFYPHHGIMYAGPMSLLLYAVYGAGPGSAGQAWTMIVSAAGLQGFLSCQHDIQAIKCRVLEIDNRPARAGKSAEEIVNYFSPLTFFLIGGTYAASAVLAYPMLIGTDTAGIRDLLLALAYGLVLMIAIPAAPWFALSMLSKERL